MEKRSILSIQAKKRQKEPIVALTCYDAATARLVDESGIDIALVGDSLANTRLGYPNTLPVTMEEMLHHVRACARGIKSALLIADMPFRSYEADPREAAKNASRFVKEGGAQAVKVEGGRRIRASIDAILRANVPVMGHLGLTPQSFYKEGGYRVKGRKPREAKGIMEEAVLLERIGVFSLVLECVPALLARKISRRLKIPIIGIGAGLYCDGQILVLDDLLGFSNNHSPKFVKSYVSLWPLMTKAVKQYSLDVRLKRFPTKEHSY